MKLCYLLSMDEYGENIYYSKWENLLKRLGIGKKIYGPFNIMDSRFNNIGYIYVLRKDILLKEINMKLKNVIGEISCFCSDNEGFYEVVKEYNKPFFSSERIHFLILYDKLLNIIKDRQLSQIGVCIDKNTKYEYIRKLCETFPLIIFFSKDKHTGEMISNNFLMENGYCLYVSNNLGTLERCEYVFDLSKSIINFKKERIYFKYYFSVYNKDERIGYKEFYCDAKLTTDRFIIDKMDIKYFDLSFVEGLIFCDDNIKKETDILNFNIREYLDRKYIKMPFINGF